MPLLVVSSTMLEPKTSLMQGYVLTLVMLADTSTCALTGDGQLLTWGEAASCSLGLLWQPAAVHTSSWLVGALTEHVIVQASYPIKWKIYNALHLLRL